MSIDLNKFFSPSNNSPSPEKISNIQNQTPSIEVPKQTIEFSNQAKYKELLEVFEIIMNQLKTKISPIKFNLYFNDSFEIINIEDNRILFKTKTSFIKNQIEQEYKTLILESILDIFGKNLEVIITSEDAEISKIPHPPIPSSNENQQIKSVKDATFKLDLTPSPEDLKNKAESKYINHVNENYNGIIIDKNKTFNNFIVGASNNMAFVTMQAVSIEPSRPNHPGRYPSIYIHSNSGLGKTHLLHSVANGIYENFGDMNICLITAREFMKEMIDSIQNKTLGTFQEKYSEKVDVLMIDDIHELENKHGTQNEFFHIFNELHNKGKQLIFTSDKSPKEIDGIAERIRTRLQWGLVIDIQRPDFETRMAILKRKAYELDLFLSDDIISLIAQNIKTSIRELEGSLIKLSAYSEVMKVDIDMELVRELLMLHDKKNEKKITIDHVIKATSQFYKIQGVDIKSKTRTKSITKARHIAMYLSQKLTNSTLQEIGEGFGGKDHTSVLHGIKKINDQIKINPALSREIVTIENSF